VPLVVHKYGGTSLRSIDRIRAVAERVLRERRGGHDVVVVASAMAGETDRLLDLARQVAGDPDRREADVLAASGEQVTVALLAMAIKDLGGDAVSLLGHQVRVVTDNLHSRAHIRRVEAERLREALARGQVGVVAGFQGIDDAGDVTTLGRGGSDTTAVAVAAALGAHSCEIFTDVDGVYTADPGICPNARRIARISHEEMLELAAGGAKVLQFRSVEFAMRYGVRIRVASSFDDGPGTWVVPESECMEQPMVAGVALERNEAQVTLLEVPDRPGVASEVFRPLAQAGIVVDMIVQNAATGGSTDLTFTVARGDLRRAVELVRGPAEAVGARNVVSDENIAKVSVAGLGMRSQPGVAQRMFDLLAAEAINIVMISTSEIKISCVVEAGQGERALRALHDGFGLGDKA
jgi:aspartate kinase